MSIAEKKKKETSFCFLINVGSISTANGSALVRMGNTTIVCGVKAEISEPELDRDGDGFFGILSSLSQSPSSPIQKPFVLITCIVPNLDLPAMCSPKFKPGPPAEEAQVLSDRLYQVLTALVLRFAGFFSLFFPLFFYNWEGSPFFFCPKPFSPLICFIFFFKKKKIPTNFLTPFLDPISFPCLLFAFTEERQFGPFTSMPHASTTTGTRLMLHF